MNAHSIQTKVRVCRRCNYLCAECPHVLPCTTLGQKVRPTECYICWHNEGTTLPKDCRIRSRRTADAAGVGRHSHAKRF